VIHILTGPVHSGKTTALKTVTNLLKSQNIKVGGFLSLYTEEKDRFVGYDLFDLNEETRIPFIRKEGQKSWQRIGSYFFIPESLDHAQNIIRQSTKEDICVVDEVGPLELEGKGLWPALRDIIALSSPEYILVIREPILDLWPKNLEGASPIKVFNISEKELPTKMVQYFTMKFAEQRKVEV
jgi:iron complex transport system ATP-binding protein